MKKDLMADGALLLISMSWGLNFVITKNVLEGLTPYMYLGIRFIIAAALMVPVFWGQLKSINRQDIKGGLVLGLFMLLGFITQTVGLLYTTAAKSGFITASNVVMVPFIAYFLTKIFPGWWQILGAGITFLGIGIISISDALTINLGDGLTLVCAVFFALQIAYTEHYVKRGNPINIAIVQVALSGVICMLLALALEPTPEAFDAKTWGAIAFAAVFCTAGAFVIQNLAQKHTSSTHTAVILCTESVFAGIFSYLILGEPMTGKSLSGFVLITAGVLITELLPLASETETEHREYSTT